MRVIWRMCFACSITKAQYVILIAFPLQQWFLEVASRWCLYVHYLSFNDIELCAPILELSNSKPLLPVFRRRNSSPLTLNRFHAKSFPIHCSLVQIFLLPFCRLIQTSGVAMYSVGLGLKSQNGDQLSWLMVFVVLCSPFRIKPGTYFKLGHDRSLPHTFRCIIFCSSYIATLHGHTQSYWQHL